MPATPTKPIYADKVDKGEDENIEEFTKVENEDVGLPLLLPLIYFTSVWKAVIGNEKESLLGTRSAIFNTKSIYYFELNEWQNETVLHLLPWKFKII